MRCSETVISSEGRVDELTSGGISDAGFHTRGCGRAAWLRRGGDGGDEVVVGAEAGGGWCLRKGSERTRSALMWCV